MYYSFESILRKLMNFHRILIFTLGDKATLKTLKPVKKSKTLSSFRFSGPGKHEKVALTFGEHFSTLMPPQICVFSATLCVPAVLNTSRELKSRKTRIFRNSSKFIYLNRSPCRSYAVYHGPFLCIVSRFCQTEYWH